MPIPTTTTKKINPLEISSVVPFFLSLSLIKPPTLVPHAGHFSETTTFFLQSAHSERLYLPVLKKTLELPQFVQLASASVKFLLHRGHGTDQLLTTPKI